MDLNFSLQLQPPMIAERKLNTDAYLANALLPLQWSRTKPQTEKAGVLEIWLQMLFLEISRLWSWD